MKKYCVGLPLPLYFEPLEEADELEEVYKSETFMGLEIGTIISEKEVEAYYNELEDELIQKASQWNMPPFETWIDNLLYAGELILWK